MRPFKNKNYSLQGLFLFLFASIFSLMSFSSCEVGLGSAVDTQAPVVSITYPPSLSIIRDTFVLSGTWSDDQGVKTVHIDVYQSKDEGKKLIHSEEATVATDGTWSIDLNKFEKNNTSYYNGYEYSDGDYEIQVQAEDYAKHTSGIASRTFSIDNTPPVLVITNPTTAGDDATPAAFGQIVQLKGSFYDFCGRISNLLVSFYDESGNAICDSNFSNISDMSDANPLTIARYYANEEDRTNNSVIYNNYVALLGSDKIQDFEADAPIISSKVYFTVTAYDGAKEYKTVGDNGTGNGNATNNFYRGTASMQNLVSGDGAIEGFSLVDFASYLNKTSTKHSNYASTINSIASAAQSFSTSVSETPDISSFVTNNDSTTGTPVYLTYTINPKNNPQFIIGGYELITQTTPATEGYSPEGYKNVYQNSPVPLNITVGADNKNISTHTVSFYLIDTSVSSYPGSVNAATFETQHDWVELLHTWDEVVYERFSSWGGDWSGRYTASSQDTNVSSLTKQLTINSFIPTHNYLFYVVGKDITGNEIIAANSTGYGFCGTISASAPTVLITGGNRLNDTVTKAQFAGTVDNLLYVSGTIESSQPVNLFSYTIKVDNTEHSYDLTPLTEAPSAAYLADYSNNYCYPTGSNTYVWRVAAKHDFSDFNSVIGTGSYNVTIELKAYNGATNAGTTQRTFTLDTSAPEASLSEITNSSEIEVDKEYWINPTKSFTISGLVTDNLSPATACTTWFELKAFDENDNEVTTGSNRYYLLPESNWSKDKKTWQFTIPANTISSSYYGANLYLWAKDAAGNEGCSATTIKLYFDSVAPKGIHLVDFYNKDIVFRVSDFDNSSADVADTEGTVAYSSGLDVDVGGKYLMGSYSNTSTLKIRGYFEEEGSGVDMIYYKVFSTAPGETQKDEFIEEYANHGYATGSFKPLAVPEERQVMYVTGTNKDVNNSDVDIWHAAKVKSSFKETIAGLDNSNNYLLLLAVDKVGNVAVDTLTETSLIVNNNAVNDTQNYDEDAICIWQDKDAGSVNTTQYAAAGNTIGNWNGGLISLSLNVDTQSPKLSCTSHSGQQYTNKATPITVQGTYSDEPSTNCAGVKAISLKIGSNTITAIKKTGTTWEAEITVSDLKNLTGQSNVDATVTDYAGNSSSATIFSLNVDTAAPVVEISTPSTSTKLNGEITLSGIVGKGSEASMGAEPESLSLYVTKTRPQGSADLTSTWEKVGQTITDASSIYSWSFENIDTYDYSDVEQNPTTATLYFIPVVTDTAGNSNIYTKTVGNNGSVTTTYTYTENQNFFTYSVDMDSDRPTVKVTNLTFKDSKYILKYGENAKIEGNLTDDDSTSTSVVKKFIATTSQITSDSGVTSTGTSVVTSKVKVGADTYDITTFNPSTGEWTFTPYDTEDKEKTVYFYIVDNADTVFYTGKTVTVNSTSYTYSQPKFQFKTEDAVDNSSAVSYNSDKTAPRVNTLIQAYKSDKTENGGRLSPGASVVLGGTEKKFVKFIITGEDANGIDGIRLTLNYTQNGTEKSLKYSSVTGYESDGFTQKGTHTDTQVSSVWTTDYIDLSAMDSGSVTGTIEVWDKPGLLGTGSPIFIVDNDGPVVSISSPDKGEQTGDITFAGNSSDGNSGTVSTSWIIPTVAQANKSKEELIALVDNSGNSLWNDTLDEDKSPNAWAFTLASSVLDACDSATYTENIANEIYTLPFFIKTTDALGNTTIYKDFTFKHNPNADRPKTEISYPNDKNYGTDNSGNKVQYVTLGGAIRITGSAIIPSNTTTVNSVYLQIINGTNNIAAGGTYTETSTWAANHGCSVLTKAEVQAQMGKTLTLADDFAWGIKADKTGSWNITINEDTLMNPPEGELTHIAIRACAINAEGKVGTWTDWYYINIDNTAPSQKANLYQLTNKPAANKQNEASTILAASNITASQEYGGAEVYLKGDWYLVVKLQDESELSSYSVSKKIQTVSSGLTDGTDYFVSPKSTEDSKDTQYLYIPVEKPTDPDIKLVEYTVVVKDSEHTISSTYSLNIDNVAPSLKYVYKGNVLTETADNVLSDTSNIITDSNYMYTLGGIVEETASGFERLVFYFARSNTIDGAGAYSTEVILDPLTTSSSSKVPIDNLQARQWKQGDNTYYMYSKAVTGTLGADGLTFTPGNPSDITGNVHIRKGGLIEAGGLLRKITDINGTTGVVTFNTHTGVTSATAATVYFPYAQVVDNTAAETVESQSANPFTFKNSSDDGDTMPETLTGSKAVGFTWDATIHSYNMADGPCTLVVLAFDKAGNVSGTTYPVKIENSAPRLAKVFLGTDLNSSGTWKSSDFVGYNVYNADTTYHIEKTEVKAAQKISTADYNNGNAFTIKDKLAVVAEIVGGNGDIIMVYGRGNTTTAAVPSTGNNAGISATVNNSLTSLVSSNTIGSVNYNNATTTTTLKGFTLTNQQLVGTVQESNDGSGKKASFTFWDSTDELVRGVSSQNCVLLIDDFTIDLVDSIPPKVVVNPFYWTSADENSLYGNSTANGHIELEGDLSGTLANSIYGGDPKVSGKVTFTGTAYDEHAIKSLKFSLTKSNGTALTGFDGITMATYDPTSQDAAYIANGGWSALTGNSGNALSAGGKYEWTITADSSGTENTTGYYDDTYYLNQGGHKVYWTISIDTAQIPNFAEKDIKLLVVANDANGVSTSSTATSSTPAVDKLDAKLNHVPAYQMDVVPYITKISTPTRAKSGLKDNNIRSASGKYSIIKGDTNTFIKVQGFNLKPDTGSVRIMNSTLAASTSATKNDGSGVTFTNVSYDKTEFYVSNNLSKSGYLELFVNNIRAMNNLNNNNAYGTAKNTSGVQLASDNATVTDYAKAYNREPDYYTTKNVQLTDDRYLLVFDMKDTGIKNGYYPVMVMSKENNRKDNPVFGYVDLKGGAVNSTTTSPYYGAGTNNNGHFPSYSMPQRAEFSANNGSPVYVEYLNKGSTWDQMGMTVDEGGRYYNVSVYNRDNCNMDFIYDRFSELHTSTTTSGSFYNQTTTYNLGWGAGVIIGNSNYTYNRTMAYSTNNNAITLESVNYNELGIGRYQYPKIVTLGNSRTGTAKVYMMYYDDGIYDPDHTNRTGGLIFRDFQIGTTVSGTSKNLYNGDTKDNENRAYAQKYNFTENTDGGNDTYTETYRHIAADNASNNFSFDVTSSGVVVFAYYDVSLSRLVLKYSSSAIDGSAPGTVPNWTTSSVQFPDNVGTYVSLVLDGNAVHISAFDSYDSNLVYMYLPTYSSTVMQAITVDQASSVGNWTQIKIKDHKPYIAYYNSTETGGRDGIKLAYSINQITGSDITVPFGVDNKPGTSLGANGINAATGYTTGSWEYMTVPALTPPQGGDPKFQNVCLDFDSNGLPVVGYLGTNLEFGKWLTE